jgi:hypothetical protein
VVENLYQELLREDPVTKKYKKKDLDITLAAALYHISRHTQVYSFDSEDKRVKGKLPRPCKQPAEECKALGLSQALLACHSGSPGIRAAFFNRYADAVKTSVSALSKVLKRLSPPARKFCKGLVPRADALSLMGRTILAEAIESHDALLRAWKSLTWINEVGLSEFFFEYGGRSKGKKPRNYHLDRITKPLLSCYFDQEIAALVPDGEEPGEENELPEGRVAYRRGELSKTRSRGRQRKPGRPKKVTRHET